MDSWAPPFLESTGQLKSRIWEKDLLLYGDDMSSNLSEDCSLLGTVLSAFHGDFFFPFIAHKCGRCFYYSHLVDEVDYLTCPVVQCGCEFQQSSCTA